MTEKTLLWLQHNCYENPESVEDVEYVPDCHKGKWALPDDYDVPVNWNPSTTRQRKAIKGHRMAAMREETHEYRYLRYAYETEQMNDTDQYDRMVHLHQKLGIRGCNFTDNATYIGWRENFLQAIRDGMTMCSACELLGIDRKKIAHFIKMMPVFRADYHKAKAHRQHKLVQNISDIALNGESETNKMKSTMFLLERQFPESFGPRQEIAVAKPTAPLDIFFGTEPDEGEIE